MSQLMTLQGAGAAPAVPQNFLDQYMSMFQEYSADISGGGAARFKARKLDFLFLEGGASREVPNGQVVGVLLGVSPIDHCTWYEKAFVQGQEGEEPDLVWNWPDHNVFPDALPEAKRKKEEKEGALRWSFQIARRSVWAMAHQNAGAFELDLDNPYIFDITSASLFGKSYPDTNMYKFSGLLGLCKSLSRPPQLVISPSMFLTQIVIDTTSQLPGVVMFRPMMADNRAPMYLDNASFGKVIEMMMSARVKELLTVKEKLDWKPATFVQTAPTATAPQPTAPQSVPQPAPVQPAPQPAPQSTPLNPADLLAQAEAAIQMKEATRAAQPTTPQPTPQPAPQPEPAKASIPVEKTVSSVTASAIEALDSLL